MAKQYDQTLKQLVESRPGDWLALAGLPPGGGVRVVDADVSGISAAADKVIRVEGPQPYVAHLEFQSGADVRFDERMLLYHVLLRWRHQLPVRTVAVALDPRALGPGATGRVRDVAGTDASLEFAYRLVRVWELPVDRVLQGGIGTLPLAPVSQVVPEALPDVVDRMDQRFAAESSPQEADVAWAATYFLGGLRYAPDFMNQLLKGVWRMEESATYRAAIEQGVARGRVEGLIEGQVAATRAVLLALGSQRFGPPPDAVRDRIDQTKDARSLDEMVNRILTVSDWHELLPGQG